MAEAIAAAGASVMIGDILVDAGKATAKAISDKNPDKHLESKFTVTTAFYAAVVRPGDWDLLHWINTWVFLHKRDGFFAGIYEKYTGLKLPELPTM